MNKIIFLLLVLTNLSVGVCEIHINYPDLTESKQIIKERQKELYSELLTAKKVASGYRLAEAYGKLAMFYHAHDYPDVAIQLYLNAIDNAPKNSKWHYLIANIYKANGDFDNAEKSFFESWKYNDGYLPSMVYLAELYMQQGKLDKAQEYFEKVLKVDDKQARALVGFGQVQMQKGDAKKAIEYYKEAKKLQPGASQINFLLSQAYASLGETEQSQVYNQVKGNTQAQLYDPLIIAMYNESRSSSYYNDNAVRAYMAKKYEAAEALAKKALSYDPKSPYPQVTLANIYVATNRAQLAADTLKRVITENDKDPNLKYSLGVIEEILGNNDKSIYWYRKVLENDPEHKKASITLSSALMRKGEFDKALKQLDYAKKLDPNNSHILHRQASIYAHQNKCNQATNLIYKAIKSQPKNFAFLLTLVKIAVHCPVDDQVLADALNAARNMYQISQDNYVVETLALIEAKNKNFDEAVDYQAQAIFQLLNDKSSQSQMKIKQLKENLELYKAKKYPKGLFAEKDIDLYPQSFTRIK